MLRIAPKISLRIVITSVMAIVVIIIVNHAGINREILDFAVTVGTILIIVIKQAHLL